MKSLLLIVRFFLEISMYAGIVVGVAGIVGGVFGWVLGVVAALAAVGVWALFISPKAVKRLPTAQRVVAEVVLFALAAALLITAGNFFWGLALLVIYTVDTFFILLFGVTEEDFFVKPPEESR